jgi:hypothetical protein
MACLHHLLNHFPYLIPLIYLSLSFWFCPWRTQYSPELFSSLILSNPLPGLRAPATQGHPFLSLRQNACPGLPTPSLHLVPTLPHNFPWPTSGAPPLPSQMEAAPSLAGNTYKSPFAMHCFPQQVALEGTHLPPYQSHSFLHLYLKQLAQDLSDGKCQLERWHVFLTKNTTGNVELRQRNWNQVRRWG